MAALTATAVILIGIWGTIQLHMAKALERQGIEIFDQLRAKLKGRKIDDEEKLKKPIIYFVGLALNATESLVLILANIFGEPSALYTSMLGVGLVVLLAYSIKVLGEKVSRSEIIGVAVVISGTLVLGIEGIFRPEYDESSINIVHSYIFIFTFVAIGIVMIAFALKKGKTSIIGLIFGLVGGGCGGMDIAFKMLGQSTSGEASLLPTDLLGWLVFLSSFAIGISAFGLTQWGFARNARASTLVTAYDSMYVLLPILFQTLLLPGFHMQVSTVIGLGLTIAGMILMRSKFAALAGTHGDRVITNEEGLNELGTAESGIGRKSRGIQAIPDQET